MESIVYRQRMAHPQLQHHYGLSTYDSDQQLQHNFHHPTNIHNLQQQQLQNQQQDYSTASFHQPQPQQQLSDPGAVFNAYNPRSPGPQATGVNTINNGFLFNSQPPSDMFYSLPVSTPLNSNPQPSVLPIHGGDLTQHHLRRKTPNGTLDTGYYGSHVYMSPGLPAFKHVVLPAAAPSYTIEPTGVANQLVPFNSNNFAAAAQPEWVETSSMNQFPLNIDYHPNPATQTSAQSLLYNNAFDMSALLKSGGYSQPNASTNMIQQQYGYGPPSPAIGAPFHAGFMHSFPSMFQFTGNSIIPQNVSYNQPYTSHHNVFSGPSQFGDSWVSSSYPSSHVFGQSSSTMESVPMGHRTSISGLSGSAEANRTLMFRERALARAHKAYVSLLNLASLSRKNANNKNGNGVVSTSGRQSVFPRPPRPSGTGSSSCAVLSSSISQSTPLSGMSGVVGSNVPSTSLIATGVPSSAFPSQLPPMVGATPNHTSALAYTSQVVVPAMFPVVTQRPLNNPVVEARESLDTLTSLCEQNGWKWVEGMIMGGCLHFGLGRLDEAAEWFRRVFSLDANRIEAISNLAVTLYVLGQTSEAESLWLKSLQLAPEYLDSAEHLLGLIYSRRGKEAIEVIDYIQSKLCVTSTTIISDSDRALGVGSSGYLIPGCDNGRMIGLIHAKGSLSYALKDTKGALAAFEEAVLISTGRKGTMIHDLVRDIQKALAPLGLYTPNYGDISSVPLLLRPETARTTAQLVFPHTGVLPGLSLIPEGSPRKVAMQATSSSLLSLAKILQDSLSSGILYTSQPANCGDILALYYLSLSLQESPSTANNVGILLATVQHPVGLHMNPAQIPPVNVAGVTPGSGLSFALAYYDYGLKLDSRHVHLHTNLGSLLKDVGQLDLAISVYEKAVACDDTFDIALTNLANAVKDRGRIQEAITYYRRAVKANSAFAEAVCGLFTALGSVCDWSGRGGAYLQSGSLDRWHVGENGELMDVMRHQKHSGLTEKVIAIVHKQLNDASKWGAGIVTEQLVAEFAHQIAQLLGQPEVAAQVAYKIRQIAGTVFEGSQVVRLIERFSRVAMWQWYNDRLAGRERDISTYHRLHIPSSLTIPTTPTVLPFHTFTCPLNASEVRMISQRNAMRISCLTLRSTWVPSTVYPPPAPPNPHLIVGYVSSDFNNHPLAHLMQSVFGFHDSSKVFAICYATTSGDGSSYRKQIEEEAPLFRDVSSWASEQIVRQIVADGCHILVNLNGYTRGARNEVFAARPTPIQMSFMGFAGTMGAEWCDYLLADESAVPRQTLRPCRDNMSITSVFTDNNDKPEGDWIYSENLVYCRDTFFCCDHAQSAEAGERSVTWEQEQQRRWTMRRQLFPQLSDDVIIMGNFNQLYKVDPTTFRTWLRILTHCPKAVLWLLRFPELGEHNLRNTALQWASQDVASRILFTDVAQKQDHISRARVCDIFLDTAECNAHTTAADILWSSTPLVTLPRYSYKMCSRMASSILRGALPKTPEGDAAAAELIASSEEEYEKIAVSLVSSLYYTQSPQGYGVGTGRLAELRKLLFDHKWTSGLFNTRRWVRDLEESYSLAWDKWTRGESGDITL